MPFHMLLETDAGFGNSLNLFGFNSLTDLQNFNFQPGTEITNNLTSTLSAGGLVSVVGQSPQPAPEPTTLALLGLGLLALLRNVRVRLE
jgi:hypothetical protein